MHGAAQPDNARIRTELRQIIADVIGGEPADIDDDTPLLDYVTSSLALLAGIRVVYERFGVLLPIRPLLEGAGSLAALAAHIDQALSDRDRLAQRSNGETADRERPQIPLAASHQHVGFLARYSGGSSSAYNEPLILRLEGPLQAPALQAAVKSVVERHEALSAALSPDTNALMLDPGAGFDLTVVPCRDSELTQQLSDLVTQQFQPGERLFRAHLLQLSPTHHVLALVGHALALDSDALSLIAGEIGQLYGVFAGGDAAPDLSTPVELAAYMGRHDEPAAREARAAANAHWRDVFAAGIPRLELPSDRLRPAVKAYDGGRAVVTLDSGLQELLRGWRETAPDAAVFGAYLALLHRLTGSNDIVVGHRSSPMHHDGAQDLVGPTRNMVPVRSSYDPDRSFADQVRSAAQAFADADRHRDFSLAELILALRLPRDQGRAALFSAAFAPASHAAPPAFGDLRGVRSTAPNSRARYDVELTFVSAADGMQLVCDYSTELFDHDTVGRWLEGLVEFLRAGLNDTQQSCSRLPIMSERQRQQLLHDWNATERPYPQDRTVLDLFLEQVRAGADRVAVRFAGEVMMYGQLAQRIEHIAARLGAAGAKAGEPVGVLLARSPDQIAAMLAAWRIGAPYVPLDPAAPSKRNAFMLQDAGVRIAVTSGALQATIADLSGIRAVSLDDTDKAGPLDSQVTASRPGDAAYVIYTSGSTGQPKGVEVTHRSLVNCLCGVRDLLGFSASDSALAIATPTFDISTVELFMPLIAGGSVELTEDGVAADGIRLAERVQACRPSFIQATPSTWKLLLAAGWKGDAKLAMGCGGEPLTRELADALLGKGRALWNMYGPTETTVNAAVHAVKQGSGQPVPIGRPCPNTQLYILDAQSEPVPIGVVGELCIGGAGVARGYVGRPELTQERFVANPFRSGERLYRSGDLARHLPNGDVVFVGRADDQAKVHGVRIELGEVEANLRALPGIRDAVASVWIDPAGTGQLVGHIIPAATEAPTVAEIRERLRDQLPDAMIPTYILVAKEFPLTASGKIDRAALASPDAAQRTTRERVAPATATERSLAAAWANILGIDADLIGRDDDFLELGGHSLQMTYLLVEVRKRFQVGFSMREFFDASTLRKFAALIQQARSAQALHANPPVHDRDSEWGKQRMAFLRREAELPPSIGPARGLTYRPQAEIKTALLTGTTGFLGAYLLAEALMTTDAQLYCLVRPKQDVGAKERIEQHLRYLELWRDDDEWRSAFARRVHALEGDVILPRLGLSDATYEKLAREIDAILHCAAYVNFIYPYEALKATNLLGVHEIIRFGFHGRIKPVHYMSTAAIWPMGPEYTFYETDPIDHGQLLNNGYDDVKWVGERCLINAADRGLPVARYRPGEVSGDSQTGRGMLHHFIVSAFKGFLQFGAFPGIETYLDMAPVDYMTKAMVHLMFRRKPLGRAFHLTNPRPMAMSDVFSYFRGVGYQFEEMPFVELRRRLFDDAAFHDNALFPFQAALETFDDRNFQLPHYDCRQTLAELEGSGIVCPPVDEALLGRYVNYLRSVGYLPEPGAPPSGTRPGLAVQLA